EAPTEISGSMAGFSPGQADPGLGARVIRCVPLPRSTVQHAPQREFIRHTIDVPLEVRTVEGDSAHQELGTNVSYGGLAFTSEVCLDVGEVIELRIPTVVPPFEARARVVWCRPEEGRFLVGVEFLDAS